MSVATFFEPEWGFILRKTVLYAGMVLYDLHAEKFFFGVVSECRTYYTVPAFTNYRVQKRVLIHGQIYRFASFWIILKMLTMGGLQYDKFRRGSWCAVSPLQYRSLSVPRGRPVCGLYMEHREWNFVPSRYVYIIHLSEPLDLQADSAWITSISNR
jgi:hypothetical protein